MIKVLASNPKQAVEIAEAFNNSYTDVVIEVKENTATENSDVAKISNKYSESKLNPELVVANNQL